MSSHDKVISWSRTPHTLKSVGILEAGALQVYVFTGVFDFLVLDRFIGLWVHTFTGLRVYKITDSVRLEFTGLRLYRLTASLVGWLTKNIRAANGQ